MVQARAGQLRHVWDASALYIDRPALKAVCSCGMIDNGVWVRGVVANGESVQMLNGANARMLSRITGKTCRE